MDLALNKVGFYFFVFGGVLVQYNLHYFVKKTSHDNSSHFTWSEKNRTVHFLLAITGLIFIITGVFSFQLNHYFFLLLLGIITLLYSLPVLPFTKRKPLKDFGILKIIVLLLFLTVITVWFPIHQVR